MFCTIVLFTTIVAENRAVLNMLYIDLSMHFSSFSVAVFLDTSAACHQ
jgi:hypothetical protein